MPAELQLQTDEIKKASLLFRTINNKQNAAELERKLAVFAERTKTRKSLF